MDGSTPFADAPVRLDCRETMDASLPAFVDWMRRYDGLGDGLGLAYLCRSD